MKKENSFITRLKNIINYSKYRLELIELKNKGEITNKEFKRKISKVWVDTIIFVLAIIIIPTVIFFSGYTVVKNINDAIEKSKEVQVPNLIGKTISEAEQEASTSKLSIKVEDAFLTTLYSDNPDAIIVEQEDKEGTILKKGDSIRVKAKTEEQLDKEKQEKEEAERKAASYEFIDYTYNTFNFTETEIINRIMKGYSYTSQGFKKNKTTFENENCYVKSTYNGTQTINIAINPNNNKVTKLKTGLIIYTTKEQIETMAQNTLINMIYWITNDSDENYNAQVLSELLNNTNAMLELNVKYNNISTNMVSTDIEIKVKE